jgi:hypothetical protein
MGALDARGAVERESGCSPAALWQALRVADVDARVSGYGRLLSDA